jgi:hypothetical protein
MKFRVTSVADGSCGSKINEVTVKLEDWLNAAISDRDFGSTLDQFMIVVVAVDDDPTENSRFDAPWNKLFTTQHPFNGQKVRSLSISVPVQPSYAAGAPFVELLNHVSSATQRRLLQRPKRVPSGFNFAKASGAISAALDAFV